MVSSQEFNNPYSVTRNNVDYYTEYLYISNTGSGQILKRAEWDTLNTVFAEGLSSVRGLCISDNILYAAYSLGLARFNLTTAQNLGTIEIPASNLLCDVVSDNSGSIYISDRQTHKIYKYNISSNEVSTFVDTGILYPNALTFDTANNRLLLVSFRTNSPIQSIQLPDGEVNTVMETGLGYLSGIGTDGEGAFYISSQLTNAIYRIADWSLSPIPIWSGLMSPADFYIYSRTSGNYLYNNICRMYIPDSSSNSISLYDVPNIINHVEITFSAGGEGGGWSGTYAQWYVSDEHLVLGYNLYYLEYGSYPDFDDAVLMNASLIPAGFNDYDYQYDGYAEYCWLELIEFNGLHRFFGPTHVIFIGNDDAVQPLPIRDIRVFPNPVNQNTVISLYAEKDVRADVSMYDIKGRRIFVSPKLLKTGSNQIQLTTLCRDFTQLAAGVYIIRLNVDGRHVTQKMIKY
jgi:hypothetical protein